MRRHVRAEVLARYQAADLGARRAARVAAHLSGCERCAAILSELTAVTGMLADIELPAMPAPVADRLQLAIARESASRAAALSPVGDGIASAEVAGPTEADADTTDAPAADLAAAADDGPQTPARIPGRPDLPERNSRPRAVRRRLRWPGLSSPVVLRGAAAAATVVVLAGGGFLLARGTTSPSAKSGSAPRVPHAGANPAHHSVSSPGAARSARLRYRLHGKVVTALALASHKNFTRTGLARQVRREVASHPPLGLVGTPASPQAGTPSAGTFGPAAPVLGGVSIGRLTGCVSLVAAGRRVVLTEVARYLGKPATIIVLRSQTASMLNVAIVGVACSATAADYIVRTTIPVR